MNRQTTTTLFLSLFIFLFQHTLFAQDKNIAKVDEYISKAKSQSDATKKADLYNKAAQLIMTQKLPKSEFVKLGDAWVEEGDVVKASQYYNRADKEDKKEGYIKIGHKMIELAPEDPKREGRNMEKAITYFTKGGDTEAGYEAVGDSYYARGKEYYMEAVQYYAAGKISQKIEKIAQEFISSNEKTNAAKTYEKMNTPEGFKKAGDLYFANEDYPAAFDAYVNGKHGEGIQKYGDKLYDDGKWSEGDAQYTKAAEIYEEKNDRNGLISLGTAAEKRGNYSLATTMYERGGATDKAGHAKAFESLYNFDFDNAKIALEGINDFDLAKAIKANIKYLDPLKEINQLFLQIKQDEPYISVIEDPETGKKTPSPGDINTFNEYYKSMIDDINENINKIAANLAKVNHSRLKDLMFTRFQQYGAVKNILDKNLNRKLQRNQITYKEVKL